MKKGISNKKRNGGKQNDASKNDDAIEKLTYPVKLLLHFSPTNFTIPLIQYLRLCVTTVKKKEKNGWKWKEVKYSIKKCLCHDRNFISLFFEHINSYSTKHIGLSIGRFFSTLSIFSKLALNKN